MHAIHEASDFARAGEVVTRDPLLAPPSAAEGPSSCCDTIGDMLGRLVIAATPIGNIGDASPRLREALVTADVIAAEDTRRLLNLATALGVDISARVLSYHDAVEQEKVPSLIREIEEGKSVVLVSDAGMPVVSDPGYRLVNAALDAGLTVDIVPGPSAVLTALAMSGLPSDRFTFEGFLPRKSGERSTRLAELAAERRTMVFFEAPHRAAAALADMGTAFGENRRVAICRELTKTFQEVIRGPLSALLEQVANDPLRGELTIVVEGLVGALPVDDSAIVAMVATEQAAGVARNAAIAAVAKRIGRTRQQVYDIVLASKTNQGSQ